jgi:hypothetical protein
VCQRKKKKPQQKQTMEDAASLGQCCQIWSSISILPTHSPITPKYNWHCTPKISTTNWCLGDISSSIFTTSHQTQIWHTKTLGNPICMQWKQVHQVFLQLHIKPRYGTQKLRVIQYACSGNKSRNFIYLNAQIVKMLKQPQLVRKNREQD